MNDIALGIQLGDRFSLGETFELVERCDRLGMHSIWVPEGRLTRDAISMVAVLADRTQQIAVGPGVLNTRTRNAALTAVTARTLSQLAPGRTFLGLGGWWEPLASQLGEPLRKPVTSMREFVAAIRSLVAGDAVDVDGEFVTLHGAAFAATPDPDPEAQPPIYLAAVGPNMLELAGECADGVNLDFLLPPEWLDGAFERIARGRERSGRLDEPFATTMLIATALDDDDPRQAIDAAKRFYAMYLANQPHIAAASGADPDLVAAIRAVGGSPIAPAKLHEAAQLIPDVEIHRVTACGTTEQVVAAYRAYLDAGVEVPVVAPLHNPTGTIDALASALR